MESAPTEPRVRPPADAGPLGRPPLIEVVVPVHNEQRALRASVERLHAFLAAELPYPFTITIADNASTDATWAEAGALAAELPEVEAVRLELKGRGRALRYCWSRSRANVVSYMDVDLSTDLRAFLPLVAPLLSGHSDLAIGTRLGRGSAVVRGPKREFISRGYNLLLRTLMGARFTDAQCGFKAVRAPVARALLPEVQDEAWFFDTELLLLAQEAGLRVHEVPVDWVDDPDSRVDIAGTILADLRGLARVALRLARGPAGAAVPGARTAAPGAALPAGMGRQLPVFAVIGAVSTLAHLALFTLLLQVWPAVAANAVALAVCSVANTAANRRFTFGVVGREGAVRHQVEGALVFLLGLGLSTGALALLHLAVAEPAAWVEVVSVLAANVLATLARFLLLRGWVFHPGRVRGRGASGGTAPGAAVPGAAGREGVR
ncbi:glycosyltransferase [Allonocardiopsis opalescens]|uniref:dolichyl-phosphate beta-glucosyltransferase n=1 Tax=Allonocardiopsis opalescens TaxID=1144618 RepID=A0A2T0Q1Q4_9ACTN|nr:glycosyltransferase [Allonocardiopsis opalescens]PRX97732.1 GtrA-like protein [Allonocardiopsis opalescens]